MGVDASSRCPKGLQGVGKGGVALCYVSDGGPSDDGRRCLVRAVIREHCCKSEDAITNNPKDCEGKDDPSNSVTDHPEML